MHRSTQLMTLCALLAAITLSGCATGAGTGALLGAGGGAALGAAIDHKNRGRGALIGAGIGALTGTVIGDQVERAEERGARRSHRGHVEETVVVTPPHHEEVYRRVEPIRTSGQRLRTRAEPLSDGRELIIRERYEPSVGEWVIISERVADS